MLFDLIFCFFLQIGYTAVMYAVSEGHVAVVELLLNQKSIDIKIQDKVRL